MIYYQDEWVTLHLGACEDVLPTLTSFDMVMTSPPYNLKRQWWDQGANGIHGNLARKFTDEWYEDSIPEDDYQAQQRALLEEMLAKCTGAVCYNHKLRYAMKREGRTLHPMEWLLGLPLWVEIIWDKGGGPALNSRRPVPADERVFVFGRPKAWHNLGYTNIWRISPPMNAPHPCPYPLDLAKRCIAMFTDPGDLVFDPYGGMGTTARACKELRRRCVIVEQRLDYCQMAVSTLQQESFLIEELVQASEQQDDMLLEASS